MLDPNSIYGNDYGIVNPSSFGTPVLTSAVVVDDELQVAGTLATTPDTVFYMVRLRTSGFILPSPLGGEGPG